VLFVERRSTMHTTERLEERRAQALFASALQPSNDPTIPQVRAAVRIALNDLGFEECIARLAVEYGEHPECASRRMRWARWQVGRAFQASPSSKYPVAG
jgi:hypothetical protein